MQRCFLMGNVASIRVMEDNQIEKVDSVTGEKKGTKVFLSIADHYYSYKDNEQKTRFISVQGFLPKNLTIKVGQLIAVDFIINPYKDNDGNWREGKNILTWDVSLRSANKAGDNDSDNADNDSEASPEVDDQGFMNLPDGIDEELPFN